MRNYCNYCVELSDRAYNLLIGAVLLWGFSINILMCIFLTDIFMNLNIFVVLACFIVLALIGIHVSRSSDNAIVSFIGYNMVVLPTGVVLSIFVRMSETDSISIVHTLLVTSGLTILMIIAAMIFPDYFRRLKVTLCLALSGVIIVELIMIVINRQLPSMWDFTIAAMFCLYIGLDWGLAQDLPKTTDNAVDVCVNLYLDIVNLFMRALLSSSKSKSKK